MLWRSRRWRSLFIAFIVPILILTQQFRSMASGANQLSPDQVVALSTKPSAVRIENSCAAEYTYEDGKNIANGFVTYGGPGSGFFVNPNGYIITYAVKSREECRDALRDRAAEEIANTESFELDKDKIKVGEPLYNAKVFLPNAEAGQALDELPPFEIEKTGEALGGEDISLIKVPLENAPILKLADGVVQLRDQVSVIGYPIAADTITVKARTQFENESKGLSTKAFSEASVTDGRISNPNKELIDKSPVLQVDVLSGVGSAGSPVLNSRGEVIGIIASTSADRDFYSSIEGSSSAERGIPIAIPASTIKEFIQSTGVKNEEGRTNFLFRDGLTAFNQGDYESAKVKFDAVKELFKDHSEVDRLISQSNELRVDQVKKPPYLFLGAIAAVLLGLIGLILFLLKRGSSAKTKAKATSGTPVQNLNGSGRPTSVDAKPYLELEFQGQSRYLTLQNDEHHLGRDAVWSDVEIPENWEVISRRHATLKREGAGYRIYDGYGGDRSSNGLLRKDGTKVDTSGYLLKNGDELIIGKNPREQVTINYFEPANSRANVRPTRMAE